MGETKRQTCICQWCGKGSDRLITCGTAGIADTGLGWEGMESFGCRSQPYCLSSSQFLIPNLCDNYRVRDGGSEDLFLWDATFEIPQDLGLWIGLGKRDGRGSWKYELLSVAVGFPCLCCWEFRELWGWEKALGEANMWEVNCWRSTVDLLGTQAAEHNDPEKT